MNPHSTWLAHQQLLDSTLPVGAFSHSFGLETLVQQGRIQTPQQLKDYATAMLRGAWASTDALGVKAVYVYAPQERWDDLWQLDESLHAARAARESREGLHKMGRRLLRLAREMHPTLSWQPLSAAVAAGRCPGTYPTVYGWTVYHLGVPLDAAAEGYLYGCLLACLNNAVRLMALGQTQAQIMLAELLPAVPEAWQRVAQLDPFDFYTAAPGAEVAMMAHETLYSRLFMS